MKEFMEKKKMKFIHHGPYFMHLASADFWLFPVLKYLLTGHKFNKQTLRELYKNGPVDVFHKWQKRLEKCIDVGKDFVEK